MSGDRIAASLSAGEDLPAHVTVWSSLSIVLGLAPAVALLAMIGVFSFLSGGYILARTAPVVLVGSLVLLALVWVVPIQLRSRRLAVAVALFAASAAWIGLSTSWSIGPDLSWVAFDLAFFYVIVLAVAGLTPVGALRLRLVGDGYLVIAVAVGIYAFLGKVIPTVITDAQMGGRLYEPVGYYNALALMMVMAVPLALEAGARRNHNVWLRALATGGLVAMLFTFFFAYSRGGYVTLAVALVVYFSLAHDRLSSLLTLLIAVAPVAAVLRHLRGLTTVFNASTDAALRASQGHTLGRWALLAVAVAVVAQVIVALVHRRLHLGARALRLVGGAAIVVFVVTLVAAAQLVLGPRGGVVHWVSEKYHATVAGGEVGSNNAGRVLSFDTGRPVLWREALKQFPLHPWTGTGAGTFTFTNYRFRTGGGVVRHAHSEWLNSLSETGIIGLALFVAAIGALLMSVFRRLRRDRDDPRRSLVAAFQAASLVVVVHICWDWTWDMAAVGTAFLLLAGTVSAYLAGRAAAPADEVEPAPRAERSWRPARLATRTLFSGIVIVLMVSWLFPYLGDRAASQAVAAAGRGQLSAAAADARRAQRYDPLAVDPLITLALVQQQQGHPGASLLTLDQAQHLQPQNYMVHQQLGLLLMTAFDRRAAAVAQFRTALSLDPLDSQLQAQLQTAVQP